MSLVLGIPINQMLDQMDARELAEYLAFDQIEPIGDIRADAAAGVIASTVANCHRSKGKSFTPMDFMPFADRPARKKMTTNEIEGVLKQAMMFGQQKASD